MDERYSVRPQEAAGRDNAQQESLLAELVDLQKKQTLTIRILLGVVGVLTVVILVGALTIVPRMTKLSDSVESSLTEMETLTDQAETSLSGINEMVESAHEMVETANGVLEDNTGGVTEALERFNEVDIESLNQAIRDLSDAIAPMAEFARMFK